MYGFDMSFDAWRMKLLISGGLLLLTSGIFALVLFIGIHFKKINEYNLISIRQRWITAVFTILIYALLPVAIGTAVYLLLYPAFRRIVFKKDALKRGELYAEYRAVRKPYPPIKAFSQVFSFKYAGAESVVDKDFLYRFSDYLDHAILLPIMCLVGAAAVSHTFAMIYAIEFFIVATALYILIAKLLYWIWFTSPRSLFFLSPNLAYIPVIFVGILFYIAAVLIFLSGL